MMIWVNQVSFASMVFLDELVANFKKRNFLRQCTFNSEAVSAPLETLADKRIKLRQLFFQYEPENIYNTDETSNKDKRSENNKLDSEYKNSKNFISEDSENYEISNSKSDEDKLIEELAEELVEVLIRVLMEKLVKVLVEVLVEVLVKELVEELVKGRIEDYELKGP
ncbi:30411_t:CDS:2, partial [Gigaspora margarita]